MLAVSFRGARDCKASEHGVGYSKDPARSQT